jgi:hypothetical protein
MLNMRTSQLLWHDMCHIIVILERVRVQDSALIIGVKSLTRAVAEVVRCALHPRRASYTNIAYPAPAGPGLTVYDREHIITYTRVL